MSFFAISVFATNTTVGGYLSNLQWDTDILNIQFTADDGSQKVAAVGSHTSGPYANGNHTLKRMLNAVWSEGRTNHLIFEIDESGYLNSLRIDARSTRSYNYDDNGFPAGDYYEFRYIAWIKSFFWAWRGGNGDASFYPNGSDPSGPKFFEVIFSAMHTENGSYQLFQLALNIDHSNTLHGIRLRPYYSLSNRNGVGGQIYSLQGITSKIEY